MLDTARETVIFMLSNDVLVTYDFLLGIIFSSYLFGFFLGTDSETQTAGGSEGGLQIARQHCFHSFQPSPTV